ncbi:MAG: hypothetical protein COU90_04780 [Candidatus Ryanbacteria bacterium CG10_big_fil_rev_8_21_14_0_10_43_42]|uniref:Uncharacterized protein n=1 Tax=Candidatus Ryanbacteria bacterium CG10_big_fil_rev_8_21_14_0_10_43_42 TaxID=1974864 RepID=A0A2M8KW65_9BACT|nr:MAG: hypothetical protein COU90_04780 [Candidatus Ryanbacteria bacterium CG10_big_fil_rev_8_21_14_0_10_43_42]
MLIIAALIATINPRVDTNFNHPLSFFNDEIDKMYKTNNSGTVNTMKPIVRGYKSALSELYISAKLNIIKKKINKCRKFILILLFSLM